MQTKGTTTNLTKLVSWDIDLYQSMDTEENCLIWLSQQEKYLLGNVLQQMKWTTRWTSELGTPQPDRDLITENMAFKLSQEYCVDICQLIIDCIEDETTGVADTIINLYNDSDSVLDMAKNQRDLLLADGNNPTCDKDMWYGGIDNLVRSLHENNQDSLQILEVATNVFEWLANVAAGIFGIEAPVLQSMADWALFIQQSILENYEAQWTQQYRETITCDLWCIATENCEITPQQLVNYFFERLGSQLTFDSLLTESLEFLVLGVWVGTEIVDAMMLSQLVFRAQFGRWFADVAFNSIDLDIRLGFDNPSTDWQLLCTCPNCTLYDFSIDEQTFQGADLGGPYEPRAVYLLNTGWGANPTEIRGQVLVEKLFVGTISGITINLDINMTDSGYLGSGLWWYRIDNQVSVSIYKIGVKTHTFTFPEELVSTRVACGVIWHSSIDPLIALAPQKVISVEFCD